jgi:pimeloyl-ACP methyl ester carboxylesterase
LGIERQFVGLSSATGRTNPAGFNPCQGVYHRASGSQPRTAFIATHYNVDFKEHYLAPLMASRGFGFLGWNTRYAGAEPWFILEHALIDIGRGVKYLRDECGVEQIVILGNSGGGSLMAAYQSQAIRQDLAPVADMKLPPELIDLPAADLYVSLNAHGGRPEVLTDWMDPSVTDENDPLSIDESLNMYNPDNGPPYDADFIARYRAAQQARNRKITDWALSEIARLQDRGVYERVFTMQRVWADLRLMDETIDPSKRPVGQCYIGDARRANFDARGIGNCSSLRSWLSMWSLDHSGCSGIPHLQKITQPSLVIQSTADTGVFPSDASLIFNALGSEDKRMETIEGDHYLLAPESARHETADLIAAWVREKS